TGAYRARAGRRARYSLGRALYSQLSTAGAGPEVAGRLSVECQNEGIGADGGILLEGRHPGVVRVSPLPDDRIGAGNGRGDAGFTMDLALVRHHHRIA